MSNVTTSVPRYTRFPAGQADDGAAAAPEVDATASAPRDLPISGLNWLAAVFVVALILPVQFSIGTLLLTPYRLVLVVSFIPLLAMFFMGKAGKILLIDWLILFSTLWAVLALGVNHPLGTIFETMGIYVLEFFGAYLLGRLTIRNARDFTRFSWVFFLVVLFLLPFAVLEGITKRPIFIELIPGGTGISGTGERWGIRRAQAGFVHPILYGAFVSAALGIAWFTIGSRGLAPLRAVVVGIATFFSMSTGALIAFVFQVIFIVYELTMKSMKRRWTLFAFGALAAYTIVDLLSNRTPFHVLVTYASFNSASAYNRILIWDWGTHNVANNPIFGLGLNDWVRPSFMSSSMDNYWLVVAVRYGLPASLAYMTAVILLVRRAARVPLADEMDKACRAGFLVSFGGLALAAGTVHYWLSIGAFFPFFIGAGVWLAEGRNLRIVTDPSTAEDQDATITRSPASGPSPVGRRAPGAGPVRASAAARSGSAPPTRRGESVASQGQRGRSA